MHKAWMLALIVAGFAPAVQAQTPLHFRWTKGDVLTYRVKHETTVTEVVDGAKRQFKAHLELLKQYRVTDVDGDGSATLDYRLAEMRSEQIRPSGEVLRFDSTDPAKSTPELREQLGKYVGTTLAVVRLHRSGRVLRVDQGPERYKTEPPFTLVLPFTLRDKETVSVYQGKRWSSSEQFVLDPPHGTGEKYTFDQECRCTNLTKGKATFAVKTSLASKPPESVQERIPLLPKEAQGEVVFDIAAGRVVNVRLTVDRTLTNHQGEGSSYWYESTYVEELVVK